MTQSRPIPLLAAGLALVFVILAAPALAAPDARVERHEMVVTLDPANHAIKVRDRMTVQGCDLRFKLAEGLILDACLVDGRRAKLVVRQVSSDVQIPLGSDGRHLVVVRYKGKIHDPVKKATDAVFVVGDHTTGLIGPEGTFLAPTTRWYPVVEGAMPRFDLEVRIPEPWRVITQGRLISEKTEGGFSVSTWKATLPSDGLYLQAGKFHVVRRQHGKVNLGVALLKSDPATEKLVLDELERYLDIYEPLLGPFPHPRFDVVENFFSSGYGMPGYTLLGGDVIRVMTMLARGTGRIRPGFLDHELMHCWWGNGVYLDYAEGNWCEGLTSYCTNYYRKEIEEPSIAIEHRRRVNQAFSIKVKPQTDYPVRAFTGKTEDVDNDIGYGKASMIFHMVRREIGDEAFWGALRDVARRFLGKRATWADFEAAFERASRENLDAFFSTWLDRKGGPMLALENVEYDHWCGKPSRVKGEIVQRGEVWPVTVEVVLRGRSGVLGPWPVRCEGERTKFNFSTGMNFLAASPPATRVLSLDPDAHLFRVLPEPAIPACLRAVLEDSGKVIVHPDGIDTRYTTMARRAVGDKGGEVRSVTTAGNLANRSLLLFGAPWENPVLDRILKEWAGPVKVGHNSIQIGEKTWRGRGLSLLVSFRRPDRPDRFVTAYFDMDSQALRRPPRIFHYGWDGYVLFDGGRPVARGALEEVDDPAVHRLDGSSHASPEPPAVDRTGEARALLEELWAPELEGRGAGTAGARRAEVIVARELYRAGLRVRRQPFDFRVLDFAGGAFRVAAGGKVKVLENSFVPFPDCRETGGPVTSTLGEIRKKGGEVLPWPPAKDRKGWAALTYPSRLPAATRARLEKARAAGEPVNLWRYASGAQARIGALSPRPTRLRIAVDPRVLEGLGDDTPVTFSVALKARRIDGANVLGIRIGTEPDAPAILVGAHYDGLGRDGDRIFPCADDNLSGVVAMLLAAGRIGRGEPMRRTVVFAGFDGEEWGLRGSRAYLMRSHEDGFRYTAMVNLDTVGRKGVTDVYVIGQSKHPALANAAMEELTRAGFGTGKDIDRFAFPFGSDHWPFHEAGIAAIDLWSSDHRVMNTSRDVPEDVDPAKVARLADALESLIRRLADGE